MQGSYKELVESNKDFIEMMNDLTVNHETQKKEENARKISEMSLKNMPICKRLSEVSMASSVIVRLLLVDLSCFRIFLVRRKVILKSDLI